MYCGEGATRHTHIQSYIIHEEVDHRCREQELVSSHHAEVESISSQYRQQTQLLLNDFNKAKKMMTSKISQLQRQ